MDIAARISFDRFLKRLRAAYRVAFIDEVEQEWTRPEDVRLFFTTFAAGFLFVSLFIA